MNKGRGRIFRRNDGKYLIYLPKDLCEDSMFPFKLEPTKQSEEDSEGASLRVKVSFVVGGPTRLLIEPLD